jgi:hypothetical protein
MADSEEVKLLKQIAAHTKQSSAYLKGNAQTIQARGDSPTSEGPFSNSAKRANINRGSTPKGKEFGAEQIGSFRDLEAAITSRIVDFIPKGWKDKASAIINNDAGTFIDAMKELNETRIARQKLLSEVDGEGAEDAVNKLVELYDQVGMWYGSAKSKVDESLAELEKLEVDFDEVEFGELKKELIELSKSTDFLNEEIIEQTKTTEELTTVLENARQEVRRTKKQVSIFGTELDAIAKEGVRAREALAAFGGAAGRYAVAAVVSGKMTVDYMREVQRQGLSVEGFRGIFDDITTTAITGMTPSEMARFAGQNKRSIRILNEMAGNLAEGGQGTVRSISDVNNLLREARDEVQKRTNLQGVELTEATMKAGNALIGFGLRLEEISENAVTKGITNVAQLAENLAFVSGTSVPEVIQQIEELTADPAFTRLALAAGNSAAMIDSLRRSSETLFLEFDMSAKEVINFRKEMAGISDADFVDRIVRSQMTRVAAERMGTFTNDEVDLMRQYMLSPEQFAGTEEGTNALALLARQRGTLAQQRSAAYRSGDIGEMAQIYTLELISKLANIKEMPEFAMAMAAGREGRLQELQESRNAAEGEQEFGTIMNFFNDVGDLIRGVALGPIGPITGVLAADMKAVAQSVSPMVLSKTIAMGLGLYNMSSFLVKGTGSIISKSIKGLGSVIGTTITTVAQSGLLGALKSFLPMAAGALASGAAAFFGTSALLEATGLNETLGDFGRDLYFLIHGENADLRRELESAKTAREQAINSAEQARKEAAEKEEEKKTAAEQIREVQEERNAAALAMLRNIDSFVEGQYNILDETRNVEELLYSTPPSGGTA